MNTVRYPVLALASSPAEPQALAQQGVPEAPRETLQSARAPGMCRIYAMHVRAFGARLEGDVILATPKDVANHMTGPGPERSLSWLLQEWTAITGAFKEVGLSPSASHNGVCRTVKGLQRQEPRAPRQGAPMTEVVIAATEPRISRGGHLESEAQARSQRQLDIAFIRVMCEALLCRSEV